MGYEATSKDKFLGLAEGFDFRFPERMPGIFGSEAGQRVDNLTIVLQEASIKVGEPKE